MDVLLYFYILCGEIKVKWDKECPNFRKMLSAIFRSFCFFSLEAVTPMDQLYFQAKSVAESPSAEKSTVHGIE